MIANYAYDDARGTVSKKTYSTGGVSDVETVNYSYDDRDRLTGMNSTYMDYGLYYDGSAVPSYSSHFVTQDHCYNGNINGMSVSYDFSGALNYSSTSLFDEPTNYGYSYDRLNRLTKADALAGAFIVAQSHSSVSYTIGDENYSYDKIGNLVALDRIMPDVVLTSGTLEDHILYHYANGRNKLDSISDPTASRHYTYDLNGNLVSDDFREPVAPFTGVRLIRTRSARSTLRRLRTSTMRTTSVFSKKM